MLRGHRLERRAHRLVGSGRDGVGPDADLAHALREIECLDDDADRPRDRRGVCDDLVTGAGDVVPARRGDLAHQHDHWLAGVVAEPLDLAVDDVRAGDRAARRVDPHDDGADLRVRFGPVHGLHEPRHGVFRAAKQTRAVGVDDETTQVDQRHLGSTGARILQNLGLGQLVLGRNGVDHQPPSRASGGQQHQEAEQHRRPSKGATDACPSSFRRFVASSLHDNHYGHPLPDGHGIFRGCRNHGPMTRRDTSPSCLMTSCVF